MITRVLSVVFVLLLSIISGPLTRAAELTPLKVIYSTLSASQSPLWVTVESGIFEKNGLAVTPVFVEGGTRSMAAMLGGEAPIGVLVSKRINYES
jgi:ABC-type nitrate/sulfonate/bicarbonate transport system substrate-binding protein